MRRRSAQTGFSLLELLVASTIFFSFMVGMAVLYSKSNRSFSRGQNRVEAQQSARVAAHAMVRELRIAGYDPSAALAKLSSAAPIQVAEDGRVTMVADVDNDGVTDRVTFGLDGSRLMREVATWNGTTFTGSESGDLADGIGKLSFGYFDGSAANIPLAEPVTGVDLTRIHRMTIDLIAVQSSVVSEERFPLELDVKLRNALPMEAGP